MTINVLQFFSQQHVTGRARDALCAYPCCRIQTQTLFVNQFLVYINYVKPQVQSSIKCRKKTKQFIIVKSHSDGSQLFHFSISPSSTLSAFGIFLIRIVVCSNISQISSELFIVPTRIQHKLTSDKLWDVKAPHQ